MVYCGRPSKGCQRCRIKRLKCNQQRPSCIQCQTAEVDCPGYRNEIDLLFRDESLSVVQKFVKSAERKSQLYSKTANGSDVVGNARRVNNREPHCNEYALRSYAISFPLSTMVPQTPIEKAATAFLLTSYLERSNFYYIPDMYGKSSTESLLFNVVEAVALAAFSNEVCQPSILELARKSYARSMHMAHQVMNSPTLVTTDETLASILLLSRFETLPHECERDFIFESWSQHVLGSLSIVQLRNQQQNFVSDVSRKMYTQVMTGLNLYRTLFPSYNPDIITQLRQRALDALDPLEYWNLLESRTRFQIFAEELSEIRRAMVKAPISEYRTILQQAIALERKSSRALSVMAGAGWSYEVIQASTLPQNLSASLVLYSDVYHVYKDAHEAQFWNSARMRSLSLNDALIDYAHDLITRRDRGALHGYDASIDEDFEHIVATCQATINRLIDDVCNSAPQFLRPGHPDCTVGACCYLVWPLFVATRCSRNRYVGNVDRCKGFVEDRLTWMAEHMKIPVAKMAVESLKVDGDRPDGDWLYPYRDDFIIPFYTF